MQETRQSNSAAGDLDSNIRSELEQADRRFCDAMGQGDVKGAAEEIYTSDAVILPPGAEIVRGREAIVEFWQGAARELGVERVELSTVELQEAGDFIHQIGRAIITAGGQQIEGKYTVLWKREDGRWKWHVDCWNLNS